LHFAAHSGLAVTTSSFNTTAEVLPIFIEQALLTPPHASQAPPAIPPRLGAAKILLAPLTIVYPESDTDSTLLSVYKSYALFLASQLFDSIGSAPIVISDVRFLEKHAQLPAEHVIILGAPSINRIAIEVTSCLAKSMETCTVNQTN
jgi:hypothetical protein